MNTKMQQVKVEDNNHDQNQLQNVNEFLLYLELQKKYGAIIKQDQALNGNGNKNNGKNNNEEEIDEQYIATRPLVFKAPPSSLDIIENKVTEIINNSEYKDCICKECPKQGFVQILDKHEQVKKIVRMKGLGINMLTQIVGQLLKFNCNSKKKEIEILEKRNILAIIEKEGQHKKLLKELSNYISFNSKIIAVIARRQFRERSSSRSSRSSYSSRDSREREREKQRKHRH